MFVFSLQSIFLSPEAAGHKAIVGSEPGTRSKPRTGSSPLTTPDPGPLSQLSLECSTPSALRVPGDQHRAPMLLHMTDTPTL